MRRLRRNRPAIPNMPPNTILLDGLTPEMVYVLEANNVRPINNAAPRYRTTDLIPMLAALEYRHQYLMWEDPQPHQQAAPTTRLQELNEAEEQTRQVFTSNDK